MRLRTLRRQGSSALAVVGSCLGVYIVLAVAFNWFVEPTVAKSREASASKLPPATIMQNSVPPLVAPAARSEPQPRIASKPIGIANDARVTPDDSEKAAEAPKEAPKKHVERTGRDRRNPWDHATSRPYEFRSVW
jgi:hypothetical protein